MEKRTLKFAEAQKSPEYVTVAVCDVCDAQTDKKYSGKRCTAYYFQELPNGTSKNLQCTGYYVRTQVQISD